MSKHAMHADFIADKTTPQGTQADELDYGHEERDVFVGSIMRWLVGTGIGVAVIVGFLVLLFGRMKHSYEADDKMPSPMYITQQLPPEPRIEGFVTYDKNGNPLPRAGTGEHLEQVRATEAKSLKSFGFQMADPDVDKDDKRDDRIVITPEMAARVAQKIPVVAVPADQASAGLMLDSSGGTRIDPHR